MKEIEVTTQAGEEIRLSYLHGLIMLHGQSVSAQWSLEYTGIELTVFHKETVKIGFHTVKSDSNTYQSWHFDYKHLEQLSLFFTLLGYRV